MAKKSLGILALAALALAGCRSDVPGWPAGLFPAEGELAGWTPVQDAEVFDRESIFGLVDGQAEFFFVYGFERVAVQEYENGEGGVMGVEVWQLAAAADAYGLYTAGIAGEPAAIGNDGDADAGRRLSFWQDRYCVHVRARQQVDDADLWALAGAVSAALPAGGERPALMDMLPAGGRVERSELFFHEEMAIQHELWLGGANLLGLGAETDGALARYEIGGAAARLLLVQYPDAAGAAAGLAALQSSADVQDPAAGDARGPLLGAVFGEVDETAAASLLAEALGRE
jgi:hypothetical protein